jgi:hypothetical protein
MTSIARSMADSGNYWTLTGGACVWDGKGLHDGHYTFGGSRLCVSTCSAINLAPIRINSLAVVSVSAAAWRNRRHKEDNSDSSTDSNSETVVPVHVGFMVHMEDNWQDHEILSSRGIHRATQDMTRHCAGVGETTSGSTF